MSGSLVRLRQRMKESPRFPIVMSTALVMLAFGLGWFICSIWTREIFVGIGPANTTFRRIAMEAAATMSNALQDVRVVYCDTEGTADALKRLESKRLPLLGRFLNRDCNHLDLAVVTDGTRHAADTTGVKAQVLAPFYKSYLQVYTRDEVFKTLPTPDLAGLLSRASKIRLGVGPKAQAAYDRACTLFGTLNGKPGSDCASTGFSQLGFKSENTQQRPRQLVELLLKGEVDAIVLGGPPCPEGTGSLAAQNRTVVRPLGIAAAPGFTTEQLTYSCLGGQAAPTPVTWTYLAGRDGASLSFAEIKTTLELFQVRLPYYFTELRFAPFTQPAEWTADIGSTGLGLDWLRDYKTWIGGSGTGGTFRETLDHIVKIISLLSAIVGLILGVRNVLGAMRAKPA
jgi:hypothetical protein